MLSAVTGLYDHEWADISIEFCFNRARLFVEYLTIFSIQVHSIKAQGMKSSSLRNSETFNREEVN